ncbi:hypothetical protein [Mesoterricola silvestris]|uniref:hypothetical protein n=1 Tax=Mesoterricola silvestris TaxID=2927979 RepID=UPI00292E09B6|nr:hypothetical protein [Mesoterricola silvestris]
MTVIAWDGKTLAADRQATNCGLASSCTKIQRFENGAIVGMTGEIAGGLNLFKWYANGSDPEKWPARQATDDWSRLIVVENGKAFTYEHLPVPVPVEDPFMAWGSGCDFAMGALAMGADARMAVEIASRFSDSCGMGVDAFDVTSDGGQK